MIASRGTRPASQIRLVARGDLEPADVGHGGQRHRRAAAAAAGPDPGRGEEPAGQGGQPEPVGVGRRTASVNHRSRGYATVVTTPEHL